MKIDQNSNVYTLTDDNQVREVKYADLVWGARQKTTTPGGIGPVLHIRETTHYEVWSWGHCGNFPHFVRDFDSLVEAMDYLFECAELDLKNDCDAPAWYSTREEAEKAAQEIKED